jgi:hypothetical protein
MAWKMDLLSSDVWWYKVYFSILNKFKVAVFMSDFSSNGIVFSTVTLMKAENVYIHHPFLFAPLLLT